MRNLVVLLVAVLSASCSLLPFDIQQAPLKPDKAVVFDIDGTLTPKPSAIFEARKGAAEALGIFAKNGYKIIYLSARITLLQAGIPGWLKKNNFPEGSIHVPQTALPNDDATVAFKRDILKRYKERGWKFVAAYGDSETDFQAYAHFDREGDKDVGIEKNRIFALERAGESGCKGDHTMWNKCVQSWEDHIKEIKQFVQSQ